MWNFASWSQVLPRKILGVSTRAYSFLQSGRSSSQLLCSGSSISPPSLCACENLPRQHEISRFYGTLKTMAPVMASPIFSKLLPVFSDSESLGQFYNPSRGMKYKGKVRRRCRSCFLTWINGTLYNLCNTHPRHKAQLRTPFFVNQRILTHATSTPKRPW